MSHWLRGVRTGLGWTLGTVGAVAGLSAGAQGSWALAALFACLAVLSIPPTGRRCASLLSASHPRVARAALVALTVAAVAVALLGSRPSSVYRTPEVRARLLTLYDQQMTRWPLAFEDVFLSTPYGRVHVVASGPAGAPPLLLLHASGIASWSWRFNAEGLCRRFRCYAVDLIGDAGRSEYDTQDHVLRSGQDEADLYASIADRLGLDRAYVVGASEGGFIATNLAMYHPRRVRKLALLGPMGYAGATQAVLRIMLAQLFPVPAVQDRTFAWAFSDDATLQRAFGEWFRLVMTGLRPVKVPPWPFSAAERRQLMVPVLFVFGRRDHLVGDPGRARALVEDVPEAEVRIVDAGHLMAAERPDEVNALLTAFFTEPDGAADR
ncbi:MAG: alpha/beta fold hydrolase [Vicinamibacterales bacterium]